MSKPDEIDEFRRWVALGNEAHGYGGVFNYKTAADKAIIELDTAREWCRSVATVFGLEVGKPGHNPNDPPDCYVPIEGQRLSVELVQLIEEEHRRRAGKRESPFAGQLFRDMQWSKERLCTKLNGIIQTKGDKYKRAARSMDVLIIHTAETWLSSGQASKWLAECEIRSHPNIASVFLLFEYEPGRGASHWPVFWLNGEIGGRSAAH